MLSHSHDAFAALRRAQSSRKTLPRQSQTEDCEALRKGVFGFVRKIGPQQGPVAGNVQGGRNNSKN